MLDHYTDDARQVIFFARYQASVLHGTALETEHVWLGILRQNRRLLRRLAPHITPEAIEARLQSKPKSAERLSMTAELPMSDATRRVLTEHPPGPIKVQELIIALLREDLLTPRE